MSAPSFATKITLDFNDGDMVVTAEVAPGVLAGGGWGVTRVEATTKTPIHPDFLETFLEATAGIILAGGIRELIAQHAAEDLADAADS
jgi:hypothetical protein